MNLWKGSHGWDASARVHTPIDEDCSYHRYIKSKTYFRPRSDFVNELFKSEGNSDESFKDSCVSFFERRDCYWHKRR